MRKSLFAACMFILLCGFKANAQKGTWIIDANGGLSNQHIGGSGPGYPPLSLSSGSFNIAVGRQLSNHFAVGIIGGIRTHQVLQPDYNTNYDYVKLNINTWNIGVYGRYTYWLSKRFFLYSQLSASRYGNSVHEAEHVRGNFPIVYAPYGSNTPPEGVAVNLVPALGVNIFKGFGLHVDLGGINYTHATPNGYNYNNVNINFGQQFNFGLHKIIGWKKMSGKVASADQDIK